jgi:hypothetical protein
MLLQTEASTSSHRGFRLTDRIPPSPASHHFNTRRSYYWTLLFGRELKGSIMARCYVTGHVSAFKSRQFGICESNRDRSHPAG